MFYYYLAKICVSNWLNMKRKCFTNESLSKCSTVLSSILTVAGFGDWTGRVGIFLFKYLFTIDRPRTHFEEETSLIVNILAPIKVLFKYNTYVITFKFRICICYFLSSVFFQNHNIQQIRRCCQMKGDKYSTVVEISIEVLFVHVLHKCCGLHVR